jgi:hypothetical protein
MEAPEHPTYAAAFCEASATRAMWANWAGPILMPKQQRSTPLSIEIEGMGMGLGVRENVTIRMSLFLFLHTAQ